MSLISEITERLRYEARRELGVDIRDVMVREDFGRHTIEVEFYLDGRIYRCGIAISDIELAHSRDADRYVFEGLKNRIKRTVSERSESFYDRHHKIKGRSFDMVAFDDFKVIAGPSLKSKPVPKPPKVSSANPIVGSW